MMQQDRITAGDSLNFLVAGGAYPAGQGWALTYVLVPRGAGAPISLMASAEGDDYRLAIAATTTATWSAGEYTWFQRVERAGERYQVDKGQLIIDPDPAALQGGFDGRSPARKALDDARQALRDFNPARRKYRIGDREMEFGSTADLLRKISILEIEVEREERAAGRGTPGRFYIRMVR